MNIELLCGDALEVLRTLPSESVHCIVTSPPYWGLRDYSVTGQLGLEKTPKEYVENLVQVFREVWRVLRGDGTVWLNLGDSYAREGGKTAGVPRHWDGRERDPGGMHSKRAIASEFGAKPKDLVGIPWRVAFALQDDGWYLRSDIVWAKKNPIPESVKDRPTKSHEYIFLLTKSSRYFYDAAAVREPNTIDMQSRASKGHTRGPGGRLDKSRNDASNLRGNHAKAIVANGRNRRDVWFVSVKPYKGTHFATFNPELITPCILAGCPEGGTVLDPFNGAATTGVVASQHGRNYIGIDLNPDYIEMSRKRLGVA
jgi:DNA modification methylase